MPVIYKRLRSEANEGGIPTQIPENTPVRRPVKHNAALITTITAVMMLGISVPTTGMVMADDFLAGQRAEVSESISAAAEEMTEYIQSDVRDFFDRMDFIKAPNVKGLDEKAAVAKLEEEFEVKVAHKKMTYEELAEKSDTAFFGDVEAQSQDMDEVVLEVAEPDMDDPLTAEMVNFGGRLAWPVPGSELITSHFGARSSPGGIGSTNHQGIDIGAPAGTDIIAAKEGTVKMAAPNNGYGNCVIIEHDNGYETLYGHMSEITCNAGDEVKPGDVIGKVGSTGVSTGPHLHFAISKNGTFVDPEPYLTGKTSVEAGDEVSENNGPKASPQSAGKDAEGSVKKSGRGGNEKKGSGSDEKNQDATKATEPTQPSTSPTRPVETTEPSQPTTSPAEEKPVTEPTTTPPEAAEQQTE